MADHPLINESCCRLCLSDKSDDLTSVFENSSIVGLPLKISECLSVQIKESDKLPKTVCASCLLKIENWHDYRKTCLLNQTKLAQWASSHVNSSGADLPFLSVQVKEEPKDPSEIQNVNNTDTAVAHVKIEPQDFSESVDEEYNELPPPLTPYRSEDVSENSQDNFTFSNSEKGHHEDVNNQQHDSVSSPQKPNKFERLPMTEIIPNNSSSANQGEKQDTKDDVENLTNSPNDENQQKIEFVAGLKLVDKNSAVCSFEPLSKIELCYIEKCKAMISMHKTYNCACHNAQHPNLKGLLSHLRSTRVWFPVFTCYNCMITFTDRKTFQGHYVKCPRGQLEVLQKLTNLRKRSDIKARLYQNYKCVACKFMYSFHEEFRKHINVDHADIELPVKCRCGKDFESQDEYTNHIYFSCLVEYYCDICFITKPTVEDFIKHAQEEHDNSEGFVLVQEDNYVKRKPVLVKKQPSSNENSGDTTKIEENSESSKRERRLKRDTISAPENKEMLAEKKAPKFLYLPSPSAHSKTSPTKCPLCDKIYSNHHNMLRHYKTHSQADLDMAEIEASNKVTSAQQPDESNSSIYACPDCGDMFTDLNWAKHLESHPFKHCDQCDKSFQFQTELDQHRSVHLNLKVYRDSKTNSYKSSVISPSSESEGMFLCELCDKIFLSNDELNFHKQVHEIDDGNQLPNESVQNTNDTNGEKKYPCNECDKTYTSYNGLWCHFKDKHPEKRLSSEYPKECELCGKVCLTGTSLASHKRMHARIAMGLLPKGKFVKQTSKLQKDDQSDESYHACNKCFKVFSCKSNLKSHMATHKQSSPSKKDKVWCDVCHEAFTSIELLSNHKEEHHSEMPVLTNQVDVDNKVLYSCNICEVSFNDKISLKRHNIDKHINTKSRKVLVYCKYCKIPFESIINLTKHMHEEHNESAKPKVVKNLSNKVDKPFKCPTCKKAFGTTGALQAHIGWHKRDKPSKVKATNILPQKQIAEKHSNQAKILNKIKNSKVPAPKPLNHQCMTCLEELPNDIALQIHILETHRNVNAIMLAPRCNTCNKDFETQEEYETHKRFHDFLERQKQHQLMKKQSPQTSLLPQSDLSNKILSEAFNCNYCNAKFAKNDMLIAHVKSNHKNQTQSDFKCSQCDRVFDKQHSLTIHLRVHEKQKNVVSLNKKSLFSCSICNMSFDLPKDLRTHTITAHPF